MTSLSQVTFTYAALLAIWFAGTDAREVRRAAFRGAWCAAFVAVVALVLADERRFADALPSGLAVAVATYAGVVVPGGVVVVLGVAAEPLLRARPLDGAVLLGAALVGLALTSAMRHRRLLAFRIVAYWASFVGTFAWVLPRALAQRFVRTTCDDGIVGGTLVPPQPLVAAILALGGAVLAALATFEFARAGGTPEPLDPPPRLVTTGIYARLRHPIEWAEAAFVLAALAVQPTTWVALYALGFVVALFGPLRLREERALARRYGEAYRAFRPRLFSFRPRAIRPSSIRLSEAGDEGRVSSNG